MKHSVHCFSDSQKVIIFDPDMGDYVEYYYSQKLLYCGSISYGSGHEGAAVLFPGFAISW